MSEQQSTCASVWHATEQETPSRSFPRLALHPSHRLGARCPFPAAVYSRTLERLSAIRGTKALDEYVTRPVWIFPEPLSPNLPRYHQDTLLHEILARRLESPDAARDFLNADERAAPDPWRVPGMEEAVARLSRAIESHEPIGVFGDYDTDGVTSAAIVTLALQKASGGDQPVCVRLPLRSEGYGLSLAGVADLASAGVKLLIVVDCGSKDHEAVAAARAQGMEVIIVDHHRVSEEPPTGAIFVSAQIEPESPCKTLSAAGLAYLLVAALAQAGFDTGDGSGNEPTSLLDLAMIGLIGDVSTLVGNNRALVRDGLRRLRKFPRPGLLALSESGGISLPTISSTDVAFQISPRLNAPGRLRDPRLSYDLLVAPSLEAARPIAAHVEHANVKRRHLQDHILGEIEATVTHQANLLDQRILIFSGIGWDSGIVGLAASKLADKYDRPVLVLTVENGIAQGSARSIQGFDISRALDTRSDLLLRHGGHERAAGLSVQVENLAELNEHLQQVVADSEALPPGPPRIEIDADIAPERLGLATARQVQTLGPFGEGNAVPRLRVVRARIHDYLVMGRERQHLKIRLGAGSGPVDAILWNGAHRSRELIGARDLDVVGSLEINQWQESTRVQVRVDDFARSETTR